MNILKCYLPLKYGIITKSNPPIFTLLINELLCRFLARGTLLESVWGEDWCASLVPVNKLTLSI